MIALVTLFSRPLRNIIMHNINLQGAITRVYLKHKLLVHSNSENRCDIQSRFSNYVGKITSWAQDANSRDRRPWTRSRRDVSRRRDRDRIPAFRGGGLTRVGPRNYLLHVSQSRTNPFVATTVVFNVCKMLRPDFFVMHLLGRMPHASPLRQRLHWLPVSSRIQFKLCTLVFNIQHGMPTAPLYLAELCDPCDDTRLRSAARGNFVVRRTRLRVTDKAFSVAASVGRPPCQPTSS